MKISIKKIIAFIDKNENNIITTLIKKIKKNLKIECKSISNKEKLLKIFIEIK